MKSIELKSAKESPVLGGRLTEVELHTIDFIKLAVNTAPEGGFTPAEMVKRVRVLDVIDLLPTEGEGDDKVVTAPTLDLEDADFTNVAKWVKEVKWAFVSRFILDFLKQFD